MTTLRHIAEPPNLLVTWQPSDDAAKDRTRRVVAVIERVANGGARFKYLRDEPDFGKAIEAGFIGHPAFSLNDDTHTSAVIEAFLRRLPPRKREDFAEFLELHKLPSPFPYSDFALLAYTGARLPSDGFGIIPSFDPAALPCEYILEVAGFRHMEGVDLAAIQVGDPVDFVKEPENEFDPGAIAITHKGKKIGYVNRCLNTVFASWLDSENVRGEICRINGKVGRPLIFAHAQIACD